MKLKIITLFVFAATQLSALELPVIFSDLMVLQRDMPVKIWGKAKAGASVKVEFAGQKAVTEASEDGNWSLFLKPMKASFEGRPLTVSSKGSERVFQEVLVGEVWLGSGQSNMAWNVEQGQDGDILLLGAYDPFL